MGQPPNPARGTLPAAPTGHQDRRPSLSYLFLIRAPLLIFGFILSVRAGLSATIVVFSISGIIASLFSSLLGTSNIVSVGASGAIFGVMAFGAVIGATSRADYFKRIGERRKTKCYCANSCQYCSRFPAWSFNQFSEWIYSLLGKLERLDLFCMFPIKKHQIAEFIKF